MPYRHTTFTQLWTALAVKRIMQTGGCSYSFLSNHEKTWKLDQFLTDYYKKQGFSDDQIDARFMAEKRRLLRSDLLIEVEAALGERLLKTSRHAFDKKVIKECETTKNYSKLLPEFAGSGGLCVASFLNGVIFEERIKRYGVKIDGIKKQLAATQKGYLHDQTYKKIKKSNRKPAVEPVEYVSDVVEVDPAIVRGSTMEDFEIASMMQH